MLSKEIQKKIDNKQNYINSNFDLSNYSYSKYGKLDSKQKWIRKCYSKEKRKAIDKRFKENHPDYIKIWKINHPEKVKQSTHRYYLKHKDILLKKKEKYRQTEKGKTPHRKHNTKWNKNHPKKHKEIERMGNKKQKAKRKNLGFNPINNYFKNSNAHHINENDVIYIPEDLHKSIWHNVFTGKGIVEINSLAFTWLESNKR